MNRSDNINTGPEEDISRLEHLALCYEKYGALLLNLIFKYVKCRHDAEEVLQEAFEKLCDKKIFIDPDVHTARLYLMKTAKHLALDRIRNRKWENQNVVHANIDHISDERYELTSLEDAVLEGEVLSTMHDVLNSLPESDKRILIDNIALGRSLKSIASERGISIYKTARVIKSSLDILKRALRDYSA